jgi:hypothetical protein
MMGSFPLRPAHGLVAIVALLMILLTACRSDSNEQIILVPENVGPGIAVISPNNTRLLKRPGEPGTVVLKLLDNEQLKLLRIVKKIYNASDLLVDEEIPEDITDGITEQRVEYTYNFTTPVLPAFYKVQYICYAIDLSGRSAETYFWVSIQPDANAPQPYQTLSYTNDTIYNSLDTQTNPDPNDIPTNSYGFNFSGRKALPGEPGLAPGPFLAQMDIAENSGSGVGAEGWIPTFYSPNHEVTGSDTAIFVMTDSTRFNFDLANYTTIFEAFASDAAPSPTAPPTNHPIGSRNKNSVQVGDIIIVKLIKTPRPQFAVMKITEVFREGFGTALSDFVRFDYKVTSP